MVENLGIKEETARGNIIITNSERFFSKRIENPNVAVCPECGEISLYIENVDIFKK
jgi:hypothetical protein